MMRTTFAGILVSVGAALVFHATSARAQAVDPSVASPVRCDEDPPAPVLAAARAHFELGQDHLSGSRPVQAEQELRAALRLFDSPNSHMLLGRALLAQGRFDDAYNEFDSTITLASRCTQADRAAGRAPRYQSTVSNALEARDALIPRVALLGLRLPPGVSRVDASVDGVPVAPADLDRPRPRRAGDAVIEARAEGFPPYRATVSVVTGRITWADLPFSPSRTGSATAAVGATTQRSAGRDGGPARAPGLRATGGAMFVVGLTASGVGAALFVSGSGEYGAISMACGGTTCPANMGFERRIADGELLQRLGAGMFWGGLGLASIGSVLFVVGGLPRSSPSTSPYDAPRVSIVPFLSPTSTGVAGTF